MDNLYNIFIHSDRAYISVCLNNLLTQVSTGQVAVLSIEPEIAPDARRMLNPAMAM